MSKVLEFKSRAPIDASVTYSCVWEGGEGENGEKIVLAHGKWRDSGREEYAILYVPPEGSYDGFDIVRHFPYDPSFLPLVQMCAEVADSALSCFIMMAPEECDT